MSTLILSKAEVLGLLAIEEVIAAVEQAFKDCAAGRGRMPPKVYLRLERGDYRAMPGALPGAAGIKWVSVYPGNREFALPTVMAVFIYSHPDTGYPLAIMDATDMTAYRTAAASACASRHLARGGSRTLGLIGAGRQAHMHLLAHERVFRLDEVKVYDIRPEAVEAFIAAFPQYRVTAATVEEAMDSDIVCTLTPATAPVVRAGWVRPGTHINAVGADAPGKQELDPEILGRARVIVDDIAQASHGGEINVPLSKGLFNKEQIWANLGQVILGQKPGRESDDMVTIFDSTGLAIEDIAIGRIVYDKAMQRGGYRSLDIV